VRLDVRPECKHCPWPRGGGMHGESRGGEAQLMGEELAMSERPILLLVTFLLIYSLYLYYVVPIAASFFRPYHGG
jgi:hypothetical protein